MSDLHSLAALYALDALDDELERARFEAHLTECADCRREVAEFCDVAADLAGAASQPPPPTLKATVLNAIDEVRQDRRIPTPSRRLFPIVSMIAVAAALLLVAVVSFRLGRTDRSSSNDVASVLLAADSREQVLSAPDGVRARVVSSADLGKAVFIAHGLPAPGPGKTYELWLITDDGPTPAGLFGADAGAATVLTDLVPGTDAIGVTIEPAGGSRTPSAPILISGALA